MMEKLNAGVPASKLFRMLQQEDPTITARKLGDVLMSEFPEISPAAAMSIQKWMNANGSQDFPDEQIDGLILHFLKSAGYTT